MYVYCKNRRSSYHCRLLSAWNFRSRHEYPSMLKVCGNVNSSWKQDCYALCHLPITTTFVILFHSHIIRVFDSSFITHQRRLRVEALTDTLSAVYWCSSPRLKKKYDTFSRDLQEWTWEYRIPGHGVEFRDQAGCGVAATQKDDLTISGDNT